MTLLCPGRARASTTRAADCHRDRTVCGAGRRGAADGPAGAPPPPGSPRWQGDVRAQCSLVLYFVVQSVRALGLQVPTLEIRDTFL